MIIEVDERNSDVLEKIRKLEHIYSAAYFD